MTDREAMQQALEALEGWENHGKWVWPESALEQAKRNTTESIAALRERLAQPETVMAEYRFQTYAAYKTDGEMKIGVLPEPVIDKSAARRIATALGWVPPSDTSQDRVAEAPKQRREQEPVAWMYVSMDGGCEQIEYIENEPMPDDPSITPLYTAPQPRKPDHIVDANKMVLTDEEIEVGEFIPPQRREWVGLTDEDKAALDEQYGDDTLAHLDAIEAKLREKNT